MSIAGKIAPYLRAILKAEDIETARREARLALKVLDRQSPDDNP